jgi:hypothetical protein
VKAASSALSMVCDVIPLVVEDCDVFRYGVLVGTTTTRWMASAARPNKVRIIGFGLADTELFFILQQRTNPFYNYSRQSQSQCQNERQTI